MHNTISINALEYAAIIINYVAATTAILSTPQAHNPDSTALFFKNNVVSKAWIRKGAKLSPAGKALGFLQCAEMINNPVGINADHVSTTNNVIAGCISQFPNHKNPPPHFCTLSHNFLQLLQWRCFHPSEELVPQSWMHCCWQSCQIQRNQASKTCLTRQEHFLAFCHSMHIDNLCANLQHKVLQNYFLACYAISLIQGKPSPVPPSDPAQSRTTATRYNLLPAPSQHTPHSCKTDFVNIVMRTL